MDNMQINPINHNRLPPIREEQASQSCISSDKTKRIVAGLFVGILLLPLTAMMHEYAHATVMKMVAVGEPNTSLFASGFLGGETRWDQKFGLEYSGIGGVIQTKWGESLGRPLAQAIESAAGPMASLITSAAVMALTNSDFASATTVATVGSQVFRALMQFPQAAAKCIPSQDFCSIAANSGMAPYLAITAFAVVVLGLGLNRMFSSTTTGLGHFARCFGSQQTPVNDSEEFEAPVARAARDPDVEAGLLQNESSAEVD